MTFVSGSFAITLCVIAKMIVQKKMKDAIYLILKYGDLKVGLN